MKRVRRYRWWVLTIVLLVLCFFLLPGNPDFNAPLSTVVYDSDGDLLSARVSEDEQWRFPPADHIPEKFIHCVTQFEDAYFYEHPGVNPVSMLRATWQNLKAGRVKSGASTISMQVIRLSRKNKSRSILEKIAESFLAVRMECALSKSEILKLYAGYAPFGGNVVGLEAASWRYYGRSADGLSWGESAALAVLPNAPSIVYPGRSENTYLEKRNRLLDKLKTNGIIDSLTCELAKIEELPSAPLSLPDLAPHLLQTLASRYGAGKIYYSSIDNALQFRFTQLLNRYHELYSQNEVHNGAILIIENKTKKIRAYIGNTNCPKANGGAKVDIITSNRSTGSLLKPFLYAAAMDDGRITSRSLIPDVPTQISGFAPKNFNKKFNGAVPSGNALTRSLNVPAVLLLRDYGMEKFNLVLNKLNLKAINRGPNHYGLSIILGGAESNLLEMSAAYSGLMNTVNDYQELNARYKQNNYEHPSFFQDDSLVGGEIRQEGVISAGAASNVLNILTELERPRLEGDWRQFQSARSIAWKTGTSYGFRDAWSIGTSPDYTVGVWVGNASGEGRPNLIGLEMAAPIMFDVFGRLPNDGWFVKPFDDLLEIEICEQSGDLAGPHCSDKDSIVHPHYGVENLQACKYHRKVHLDQSKQYLVNSDCYAVDKMIHQSWFVLPPTMEWYYIRQSPNYRRLPPMKPGCFGEVKEIIQIAYPPDLTKIKIPVDLDGKLGQVVFEANHQFKDAQIFWHIDDEYQITTRNNHKFSILPSPGKHTLTLVDDQGNSKTVRFEAVE